MKKNDIRHEGMRIGGEKILTEKVIEVKYPYTMKLSAPSQLVLLNTQQKPLKLRLTIGRHLVDMSGARFFNEQVK